MSRLPSCCVVDLGEDQDALEIGAEGLEAGLEDIGSVVVGDQQHRGNGVLVERDLGGIGVGGGVEGGGLLLGAIGREKRGGGEGGGEVAGELGQAGAGGSGDQREAVAGEQVGHGPEGREVGELIGRVEFEADVAQEWRCVFHER